MDISPQLLQQIYNVKIVEQPAPKALRFRYECEGRSAGSLPGATSSHDKKTFPKIQVVVGGDGAYGGMAPLRSVVVVSCVTTDPPYRPHPHNLVGKEGCKKGVCTMEINNDDMTCEFSNLGIQCVKKKDIEDSLRVREEIRVDPFRTGFGHKTQPGSIDLNSVRLCFQVFLEGPEKGQFKIPLRAVVSDPIYDKKAINDLTIMKLSDCTSPVIGNKEIILLCDKVSKDDVEIRFYEEDDVTGGIKWEAFGDFQPSDVHKQYAICFRTPPFRDLEISNPVRVWIQLRCPSKDTTSIPRPFDYAPLSSGMKKWTFGCLSGSSAVKRKKTVEEVLCSDDTELYSDFAALQNPPTATIKSDLNEGIYDFDIDLVTKLANDLNGNAPCGDTFDLNCGGGIGGMDTSETNTIGSGLTFNDIVLMSNMGVSGSNTNNPPTDNYEVPISGGGGGQPGLTLCTPTTGAPPAQPLPPMTLPLTSANTAAPVSDVTMAELSPPPPRPPKSPSASLRNIPQSTSSEPPPSLPPKKNTPPSPQQGQSNNNPSPSKTKMPSFFKSLFSPSKKAQQQAQAAQTQNNTQTQQQQVTQSASPPTATPPPPPKTNKNMIAANNAANNAAVLAAGAITANVTTNPNNTATDCLANNNLDLTEAENYALYVDDECPRATANSEGGLKRKRMKLMEGAQVRIGQYIAGNNLLNHHQQRPGSSAGASSAVPPPVSSSLDFGGYPIKQEPGTHPPPPQQFYGGSSPYGYYADTQQSQQYNFPMPALPQDNPSHNNNSAAHPPGGPCGGDLGNISLPNLSDVNLSLLESHLSENFNENLNISESNFT